MSLREQTIHVWTLLNDSVLKPMLAFMHEYWRQEGTVLLYVAAAFAIGYIIGRRRPLRGFQNRGELSVADALMREFRSPTYHLLNHVTLEFKDSTTQIDHILVSRFGVFVIETKDYSGWIFGSRKQSNWTQVLFRSKVRFQNPIHQNKQHVRAVQQLLDFLLPRVVEGLVVFAGNAEFKTEIPEGVFDLPQIVDYLRAKSEEVMSINRVQFCVGRIETARLAISRETDVQHVENLGRRHGRRL